MPVSRHPNATASMAQFLASVRNASSGFNPSIQQLRASATSVSQESSGADGGYAVPVDFMKAVSDAVAAESDLLGRCTVVPVKSNTCSFPVDVQPAYSSSGPQTKVTPEGAAINEAKLSLQARDVRLSKVATLLPMSAELIEDAGPELDAYLVSVVGQRLGYQINEQILRGNGTGEALGLLSSPALITVTKETQASGSVVIANIEKMYARLLPSLRPSGAWIVHTSVEQQLLALIGGGAGHLFTFDGPDTYRMKLLGMPVIPIEAASAAGTVGDITLVGMSGVAALVREGIIKKTLSMDVYFDQDLGVYRFSARLAALTFLGAAVSQKNGSSTVSSVVSLEARP